MASSAWWTASTTQRKPSARPRTSSGSPSPWRAVPRRPPEADACMRPSAIGIVGLLVAAVVVLCALGTWQVVRLQEAREAKAHREERIAQPPLDWRSELALGPRDLDYRRVRVSGTWDHARTTLIANRVLSDVLGREAVTPLLPDDGGPAVLVNRGWFPDSRREEVL